MLTPFPLALVAHELPSQFAEELTEGRTPALGAPLDRTVFPECGHRNSSILSWDPVANPCATTALVEGKYLSFDLLIV